MKPVYHLLTIEPVLLNERGIKMNKARKWKMFTAVLLAAVLICSCVAWAAGNGGYTPPANLAELESLTLTGYNLPGGYYSIDDLSFLEDATNLKELNLIYALSSNADLTPLEGLTGLEVLYIYSGNLENDDLVHIGRIPNLKELSLILNNFSEVSGLAGLTNLEELTLYNNYISNISGLAGLTNLKRLDLYGNNISDISALAGLTNLKELDLGCNPVENISQLANMASLETLYLDDLKNIDLSTLPPLENLKHLACYYSSLGSINDEVGGKLAAQENLQLLDLEDSEIQDISGLSKLASLGKLNMLLLDYNDISDISPLSSLTNVRVISLNTNNLDYSDPANYWALNNLCQNGVWVGLNWDYINKLPDPILSQPENHKVGCPRGQGFSLDFSAMPSLYYDEEYIYYEYDSDDFQVYVDWELQSSDSFKLYKETYTEDNPLSWYDEDGDSDYIQGMRVRIEWKAGCAPAEGSTITVILKNGAQLGYLYS